MNTPEIAQKADALVAEVRRVYRNTEASLDTFLSFGANATELAQLRSTLPQIESWETTVRGFAERGRKDSGSPYTWSEWADHGKTLADSMRFYADVAAENGPFVSLKNAARAAVATVETVGGAAVDVVNIGEWKTSTKLLIGAAVAALLLMQLRGVVGR